MPFIGRKNGTLTSRQQCYNDVHGWYRARIEQLFARLWHWGLIRNIWRGGPNELHQSVRILLHFTQFCIRRQVRHPPYGPWEHVPPHVWTDQRNSAAKQDEAEDEAEVCVLCCQRRSTVAVCDECKEHYCNECIDTHTCDECCSLSTLQMTVGVVEFTDIALLCNVLCREGVQCNVVYLGGFSMRG